MDDKLIMNNYLLVLKSTVEVFVHGTLESSNEDVRSTLKDGLNEILTSLSFIEDILFAVFSIMLFKYLTFAFWSF